MPATDRVTARISAFPAALGRTVIHVGEYLAVLTVAAELATGDLIIHPDPAEHGALHRVTKVDHAAEHVVVHSRDVRNGKRRRHKVLKSRVIQRVLTGALSLLTAVGVFATAAQSQIFNPHPALAPPTATATATVIPGSQVPTTRVPAPRAAAGYQKLFASIDPQQWGAADGAMTVCLPDGRSVWLFGDTASARPDGFVHSTAIVQRGGELHVSHHGAQLIPDDDATHIFWIYAAKVVSNERLDLTARSVVLTGNGLWDFRDGEYSRTAECSVSPAGDVTFVRWVTGPVECPPQDPGPMYNFGDGDADHFGYLRFTHPELRLRGGNILVSTSQNWNDTWDQHRNADGSFRWSDYQPVFSETLAPVATTPTRVPTR
jgi:hypothetical protein